MNRLFMLYSIFTLRYIGTSFGMLSRKSYSNLTMKLKKNDVSISKTIYKPRGINQQKYFDFLNDPNVSVLIGLGPAGSGKTLFACNTAVQLLKNKQVERIVITRPLISVDDEQLGFLPGSMNQKMDPWTRPIFDILEEFYSKVQIKSMIDTGVIEISPLAYMRGRTFKQSFIIADEMQNSSPNQMLMMLTRIGEGSRLTITGDLKQSDRGEPNGLSDFIHKYKSYEFLNPENTIRYVELEAGDIQRSPVVSKILNIYDYKPLRIKDAQSATAALNKKKGVVEDLNQDAALIPKNHFR